MDIITDTEKIQRVIRTYFKNLHSTYLESLKDIESCVDTFHLPNLNHDQISN